VLKERLSFTAHVGENGLPKMPSEELIGRAPGVIEKLAVEKCSSNIVTI
jgi:hypothetical protein